jgi:vacuolar-type H+-ATPase subunit I/STV1
MMFWLREVAGWLLILLGLFLFLTVYSFCQEHWIFEAFIVMIAGVFVFRGGIHLLKVAVASRVCARADERLYPALPPGEGPRAVGPRRPAR